MQPVKCPWSLLVGRGLWLVCLAESRFYKFFYYLTRARPCIAGCSLNSLLTTDGQGPTTALLKSHISQLNQRPLVPRSGTPVIPAHPRFCAPQLRRGTRQNCY